MCFFIFIDSLPLHTQIHTVENKHLQNTNTMIKNPFCRPRLRTTAAAAARKNGGFSLLDRLREAVFRLIMISALSKGSNSSRAPPSSDRYCYPNDPHHSEAVADCIEFIKKSATASDEPRRSTADDAAARVVIPLPVM